MSNHDEQGNAAVSILEPPPRSSGFFILTGRYGLSEGAAQVVALACLGLECKEIASALGVSESTIKKKLSIAARRLKARGRGNLCALCGMLACGIDLERARMLLRENGAEVGRASSGARYALAPVPAP